MNNLDLNTYIDEVRNICARHNWKKDWSHGGCYAHLELSEFIEAIRGKGDPIEELGDVLFTILAVADFYGVDTNTALKQSLVKHHKILEAEKK